MSGTVRVVWSPSANQRLGLTHDWPMRGLLRENCLECLSVWGIWSKSGIGVGINMTWGANKKGGLAVFDQWEDWQWTHAVTSSYIFGMPVLKNKSGNFAGLRLQAFEVIICPAWCQDLLLQEISISSQPPAYCNTGCLKEERQEKRETVQQHNQLVKSLCKVFVFSFYPARNKIFYLI